MSPELDKKLSEEFPVIFTERTQSPRESCMGRGFEHGDGWFQILYFLCKIIMHHCKHHPEVDIPVFNQVKEKFGTLRIYYTGGDQFVADIIQTCMIQSQWVCETCGSIDEVILRNTGWLKTLCQKCFLDKKSERK